MTDGWQPIETAPKDGTEFQAWVRHDDATEDAGNWEPRARFNEDECFELWGRVDYDQDGWDNYPWLTPTHWMPLPKPPPENVGYYVTGTDTPRAVYD